MSKTIDIPKLTVREIQAINLLYLNSKCLWRFGQFGSDNKTITYHKARQADPNDLMRYIGREDWVKPELIPLPFASDEHCIDVAELYADSISDGYTRQERIKEGSLIIRQVSGDWSNSRWNMKTMCLVIQFLIREGYALPVFLEKGHPANGFTPIELNLAFNKLKK